MHLIRHHLSTLRGRLAGEDGFTLVAVMGIITAALALSVAAFAATDGDFRSGAADKERKQAYAAAEAGVADYLAHLVAKPDYWRECATDTTNLSLNQVDPGTARKWAPMAGSTGAYSVELLPANGKASCDVNDPVGTFIDTDTGTFRIRSTGRARVGSRTRSVIATFRRKGFLDYIYYTDYETADPAWLVRDVPTGKVTREDPPGRASDGVRRDLVQWGVEECTTYWRNGRGAKRFRGTNTNLAGIRDQASSPTSASSWTTWPASGTGVACGEIRFVGNATSTDRVNGPLHTNDELLLCGSPVFGRRSSDDIEVSGNSTLNGYRQDGGCSGAPVVNLPNETDPLKGTLRPNAPLVSLPPSNATLKEESIPAYRFLGKTSITLNGTSMTVQGKRENGTVVNGSMPMPKDGVIYVSNDTVGSCAGYDPENPYGASAACGDVWLKGTYDRSITISAENDIVLESNVTAGGGAKPLLGLVSNNWIRVFHKASADCTQNLEGAGVVTIEAAILSLRHSFTVDNYWCGPKIGELKVTGAIAQKYRGPVGTGGASSGSGYVKNYNYNDELRFRSPPRFLNPVQTTWKLKSQVEQVPPAT